VNRRTRLDEDDLDPDATGEAKRGESKEHEDPDAAGEAKRGESKDDHEEEEEEEDDDDDDDDEGEDHPVFGAPSTNGQQCSPLQDVAGSPAEFLRQMIDLAPPESTLRRSSARVAERQTRSRPTTAIDINPTTATLRGIRTTSRAGRPRSPPLSSQSRTSARATSPASASWPRTRT